MATPLVAVMGPGERARLIALEPDPHADAVPFSGIMF